MSESPRAYRVVVGAAMFGLMLSFPVAVWWLVGDLSSDSHGEKLYHIVPPPDISAQDERTLGIASIAATAVTMLTIVWAALTRRFDQRWWIVLTLLLVAGFVIGGEWRVATAGEPDANIGGGLYIMFGAPFLIFLLVAAAAISWWIRTSQK